MLGFSIFEVPFSCLFEILTETVLVFDSGSVSDRVSLFNPVDFDFFQVFFGQKFQSNA